MDVGNIIARLHEQLEGWVLVGGSADLDAAIAGLARAPAAFVLALDETALPNDRLGAHHQVLHQRFAVVLVVSNLRDLRGAAASAELAGRCAAVRAALLGWVPDAANGQPVAFASGRLLQFEDQLLWWQDEFTVGADLWAF